MLLIDYKMVKTYGFNGTTLINYINDSMRDIQRFIMTAVDTDQITDGLVADRDKYSKNIFDTEAADQKKEAKLREFIQVLLESAKVFEVWHHAGYYVLTARFFLYCQWNFCRYSMLKS